MGQDSRLRSDSTEENTSWNRSAASSQNTSELPSQHDVAQVARTLAAYGGGSVAIDLALDLVLNEVVEQACAATKANGAAIAFMRDGEMVCRATTGESAPDLGVRVDASSGLVGDCIRRGEVQLSQDAETDARVNAEACRRLGVRSMVVMPLLDKEEIFGVLQVFSSRPNAFGESEISTLRTLAGRVADTKKEVDAGVDVRDIESVRSMEDASYDAIPESSRQPFQSGIPKFATDPAAVGKGSEIWTTLLLVLLIGAAVLLGVEMGWHRGAQGTRGPTASTPAPPAVNPVTATEPVRDRVPETPEAEPQKSPAETPMPSTAPVGGLIVTEGGNVVYRSPEKANGVPVNPSARPANQPIHRVEPEYPAEAQQRHIQGAVVLDVQILKDGSVGNISIVSGDPILADSAVRAVQQWRYRPNLANGRQVEGQATVTVHFKLPSA